MTPEKRTTRPLSHLAIHSAVAVFLVVAGLLAALHLYVGCIALRAPGPNTVGEAGKVYFAKQCCTFDGLFAAGDQAPFYPSFHGALLHASVGVIGKVAELSTTSLYYVGRAFSVSCTIISLILCSLLLRRWSVHWWGCLFLLIVFFATYRITQHTYSYRSDNWLLLLSTSACYLLVAKPGQRWALSLLAVIPALAFFLKANGGILLATIALSLMVQRRNRDAVICVLAGSFFLLILAAAVNQASEGLFLAAMRNAAGADYSMSFAVDNLNVKLLWIPLFAPVLLLRWVSRSKVGLARERTVVTIFWAVSLCGAALTSLRAGSNSYYFLEPFTFGTMLVIGWLADMSKEVPDHPMKNLKVALPILVMIIFTLLGIVSLREKLSQIVNKGVPSLEFALTETRWFSSDRIKIAAEVRRLEESIEQPSWIKGFEWPCLSDDPGLNVLLKKPLLMHPLLTSMMIKEGILAEDALLAPIRQRRVAMIVLTGYNWTHAGVWRLPDSVYKAIEENYRQVASPTRYTVLLPKSVVVPH